MPYYLPGIKGGGPIITVINLVEQLGDEYEFLILAGDRDLGDEKAFPDITYGIWQQVGLAKVCYLSPSQQSILKLAPIINEVEYDILYISSYFARLCVKVNFLRKLNMIKQKPTIIAPKGEFSGGALRIKRFKKQVYIRLSKIFQLHKNLYWHATATHEEEAILEVYQDTQIVPRSAIYTISTLPGKITIDYEQFPKKKSGEVRIAFLSRISPMKNLDYALRILTKITTGTILFDIYGPIEDEDYWRSCQRYLAEIPDNVSVNYQGMVTHSEVVKTFSQYHMLFLPSRGESFGHVIWEALCAGCLLLISDKTPWRDLVKYGVGWDIHLSDENVYADALQEMISLDNDEFVARSTQVKKFAQEFSMIEPMLNDYRAMFQVVLN